VDFWTLFWTLLTSVIGSFAGAWLAAHFALKRFYKEKVWERKTAAYSAIFEALHDMSTWYKQHFNAMVNHREIPEEQRRELTVAYQLATNTFQRRQTRFGSPRTGPAALLRVQQIDQQPTSRANTTRIRRSLGPDNDCVVRRASRNAGSPCASRARARGDLRAVASGIRKINCSLASKPL
jgi:hypothetical protein